MTRPPALLLWPLLLLTACSQRQPPVGGRSHPLLTAPVARLELSGGSARPFPARELLRRGWGSGPDQLGRREEASRPGPMSLAVDGKGQIHLLDQVNRRLLRFDADGRQLGALPLEGETAEDLVPAGDRTFVLYYEPGSSPGYRVVAHGQAGEVLQRQRLHRSIQLATGLFALGAADAPDLYVERAHFDQVQVASQGRLLPEERQTRVELGRAARGGGPRLLVGRVGERGALVRRVLAGRYTAPLLELELPARVAAVEDWLLDEQGRVLLSILLEQGSLLERRLLLWEAGVGLVADWQAPSTRGADVLRPLALSPGGQIVSLESDAGGVSLRCAKFPGGGSR